MGEPQYIRFEEHRAHVLQRPETYLGAIQLSEQTHLAFTTAQADAGGEHGAVVCEQVHASISSALLQVVNEAVGNAIDNARRTANCSNPNQVQRTIKLSFAPSGEFSVFNDGRTIPVDLWPGTSRYKIEILFSELMSGENFVDTDKRHVGGRNGLGIKAVNIFSEWFEVEVANGEDGIVFESVDALNAVHAKERLSKKHEDQQACLAHFLPGNGACVVDTHLAYFPQGPLTVDTLFNLRGRVYHNYGPLRYKQRFERNMSVRCPPTVMKGTSHRSSTFVRWKVDLARLGMEAPLHQDVMKILDTRAFDAAACTASRLSVYLNDRKLDVSCLRDYAACMVRGTDAGVFLHQETLCEEDAALDVCFLAGCRHASVGFVNGVRCSEGVHMDMIFKALAEWASEYLTKKTKRQVTVRPPQIRVQVTIVVSALVVNPTFTSQTKTRLDLVKQQLGIVFKRSEALERSLQRHGVYDRLIECLEVSENRKNRKTVRESLQRPLIIPKYDPALHKDRKTARCSLWVVEGDSAKALFTAGCSEIGREEHGVFALRGKLVNVDGMTPVQTLEYREVRSLTQILGLDPSETYTAAKVRTLPYKSLVVFTDQDTDGSHIAGLLLYFLQHVFPSLLAASPDFVKRFVTPVIRVGKAPAQTCFYSVTEYDEWVSRQDSVPANVKYYKGLATNTSTEARALFRRMSEHLVTLRHSGDSCAETLSVFFSKKRAADRRAKLQSADPGVYVDYTLKSVTMTDFCEKELLQHFRADNRRSIPSAIDGLKPSQRKILKHGMSTMRVAKKVAKEVAKKVNQFASDVIGATAYHHGEASMEHTIVRMAQKYMGANNIALLVPHGQFGTRAGGDAGAPRYISTECHAIARYVFPEADDAVLQYDLEEDRQVEPRYYCGCIAFALVNGFSGIGSGWNTSCPAFSPLDIISNTRRLVNDPDAELLDMVPWYFGFEGETRRVDKGFEFRGKYTMNDDATEIRITELPPGVETEKHKESMLKLVGDADSQFVLGYASNNTEHHIDITLRVKPLDRDADHAKALGLLTRVDMQNLKLFDEHGNLRHYEDIHAIMRGHAKRRRQLYESRLEHLKIQCYRRYEIALNKARFVSEIIDHTISPNDFTVAAMREYLKANSYYADGANNFEYLAGISLFSLTSDQQARLRQEAETCLAKKKELDESTAEQLWVRDLDALETQVRKYLQSERANRPARRVPPIKCPNSAPL